MRAALQYSIYLHLFIHMGDVARELPEHNIASFDKKGNAMNLLRKCRSGIAILSVTAPLSALAVPVTDGLELWLQANSGISASDGGSVLLWQDQSSAGNDAVYNPSNSFGELAPSYDASNPDVAGQATVRFDNRQALEVDLTGLVGSDYTIFAVNGRDRLGLANFYLAGDSLQPNSNLVLGYENPNLLRQSHFANDLDAVVENYVNETIWSVDIYDFDQTQGRSITHNGNVVATDSSTSPLLANSGTTLGHFRAFGDAFWYQGDLAELVVYNRSLSNVERLSVAADLTSRYGLGEPASVPEPHSLGLLLLGVALMGRLRRRT